MTTRKHLAVVPGNILDSKDSSGDCSYPGDKHHYDKEVCQSDGLSRGCIAHVSPGTRFGLQSQLGVASVRLVSGEAFQGGRHYCAINFLDSY